MSLMSSPGSPLIGGLLGAAQYEFTIRWSQDRQFYWTLHNTRGNVEPVATSETYVSKEGALHSIRQIMALAATANIDDKTGK